MSFQWQDNSIRILSVFIAILLWVYVTNEQNPVIVQTFTIPLVAQDSPRGYVTDGVPHTVSVRVRGTRIVISTLQREDFSARVNLSGIKDGEQDLAVKLSAPSEVEVLQVSPSVVQVRGYKIEQKNVPVTVALKGKVAQWMQAGQPVVNPPVVAARGPAKVLKKINRLGVSVNVSGIEDKLVREVALETGREGVTLNPNRVTVTVPVTNLPVQSLPVNIQLIGEPAADYEVSETTMQPQEVQVTMDNVSRELTAVSTMPLDISGVSSDVEKEVILMLPDGARSVKPDRVTVTVRISKVEENQPPPEEENGGGEEKANPTDKE